MAEEKKPAGGGNAQVMDRMHEVGVLTFQCGLGKRVSMNGGADGGVTCEGVRKKPIESGKNGSGDIIYFTGESNY